jgi:hypothetical protein
VSEALRAHLKDDRFQIVTSVRGLPLGVRDGLQTLFGDQALDIAEPGAEFQVTDVARNFEAADPSAGRGGVLDGSLPRLLRARRHRPHVAGGAVSLDAGGNSVRVGRQRPSRPQDHRRRSQGCPVRSDQDPEQDLVATRGVGLRERVANSHGFVLGSEPHNRPDAELKLLHEFAIEDHETAAELDRAAREPAD